MSVPIVPDLFRKLMDDAKKLLEEVGKDELDLMFSEGEGDIRYTVRVVVRKERVRAPVSTG